MTETAAVATAPKPPKTPAQSPAGRYFHAGASAVLLLIMFLGFQQFYLHGKAYPNRPLAPPIRTLLISHGLAMTTWMLLLFIQPLLILNRKHKIHMLLGKIGAVLAAAILILGFCVAIQSVKFAPPEVRLWNLTLKQFMVVSVTSVLLFATFVAAGIWYRKRPDVHRSMMLLATLAVIPAAADRIGWLTDFYRNTIFGSIFGPYFSILILGMIFLLVKWALNRHFDRIYAAGLFALTLISFGIMQLAPTKTWDQIASFLLQ